MKRPEFYRISQIQYCAKSEDNFQNVPIISYKTTIFQKKYFEDISYPILIKFSPPNREFETVYLYYLCCGVPESAMQTQRKNNVTILLTYLVKRDIKISIFSLNHS